MASLTVRIDEAVAQRLDRLAERLERPQAEVAAQAIEDFLALQEWQIGEIEAGLAAADRGEFATKEQLADILERFTRHAGP